MQISQHQGSISHGLLKLCKNINTLTEENSKMSVICTLTVLQTVCPIPQPLAITDYGPGERPVWERVAIATGVRDRGAVSGVEGGRCGLGYVGYHGALQD